MTHKDAVHFHSQSSSLHPQSLSSSAWLACCRQSVKSTAGVVISVNNTSLLFRLEGGCEKFPASRRRLPGLWINDHFPPTVAQNRTACRTFFNPVKMSALCVAAVSLLFSAVFTAYAFSNQRYYAQCFRETWNWRSQRSPHMTFDVLDVSRTIRETRPSAFTPPAGRMKRQKCSSASFTNKTVQQPINQWLLNPWQQFLKNRENYDLRQANVKQRPEKVECVLKGEIILKRE